MTQDKNIETQKYYGTKLIEAWPEDKDGQEGYAVKYEDGYISWSPKEVFEKAYQPLTAMSFGHAIEALKAGQKVCRARWNGKGMFLFLVPDSEFRVKYPHLLGVIPEGTTVHYWGHIDMKAVDGKMGPWLASQTDMLANDWQVVPD